MPFYFGPKDYQALEAMKLGLEKAVDFGWFDWIGRRLLRVLRYLKGITGNYGWATVLSQGLANKGINRLAQAGQPIKGDTLDRIQGQLAANFDDKAKTFKPSGDGAGNRAWSTCSRSGVASATVIIDLLTFGLRLRLQHPAEGAAED